MSRLDPIIETLNRAPRELLDEIDKLLEESLGEWPWVPTDGPQLEAFNSYADEVFYGGSAGGGKSSLATGLALTQHRRSLILRRYDADAVDLAEQVLETIRTRDGWNGQKKRLRYGHRLIDFGGCKEDRDKQRYKGNPHDLIVFDELPDFLQSQYEFIIAWNRSTDPNQRCRIVATGNPPTEALGLWVIQRWGPWLDPRHPKPAKSGELRWYVRGQDGRDVEVDGPGEYEIGTERVQAKSRTFIRARLDDNPDLTQTDDYRATLDALPIEIRSAYRDGKFDESIRDNPYQVIPTSWVRDAINRWQPMPPRGVPMCSIGVDGARVHDESVLAPRHDGWYPKLIAVPGKETPDGRTLAGLIVTHRRDNAVLVIDVLESVGAQAYAHLKDQGLECVAYRGYDESTERTRDKQLPFYNRRAAAYWSFREALDPNQDGGSPIALPDDPELIADLTAVTFELTPRGIKCLPKDSEKGDSVKKRLGGRSPNKGDAVVMAWYRGPRAATHLPEWVQDHRVGGRLGGARRQPQVNYGPRRVGPARRR